MDFTRRAKPLLSLPESRRASDFFRPVTTAAYGTNIPLVIGQQRVPTTVIRDGRTAGAVTGQPIDKLTRYGLCEGPILSIGKMFADQGQAVEIAQSVGANGHFTGPIPWVGVTSPSDPNASPESRSFEVSTDITLAGADASYITYGQEPQTPQTAAGQLATHTDCHVCTTGSYPNAKQYMVLWSYATGGISLYSRPEGGAWAFVSTITSATVNASVKPVAGALPQPRVAAVGDLVHVVWSRLDNGAEPVQVCHAWSTNAGATWTIGQSLTTVTKASAIGVWKLQLAMHASGEVWVCFQKRNVVANPAIFSNNTMGACVGFLPSTATASTAWILPDTASRPGCPGLQGEMSVLDPVGGNSVIPLSKQMLRAPSILPLGAGRAMLSAVYVPANSMTMQALVVAPIKADTLVRWDLPAAAFQLVQGDTDPHSNVASLPWLNANSYLTKSLGWLPQSPTVSDGFGTYTNPLYDYGNEGSTQILWTASATLAVLVNHSPKQYPSDLYRGLQDNVPGDAAATPAGHPDRLGWGEWRVHWATFTAWSITWVQTNILNNVDAGKVGYMASAFCNGNGQLFVTMGMPAAVRGGTYWECYSAPRMRMVMLSTTTQAMTEWLDYWPASGPQNSVGYQFWAQNGEAVAIWRENEEGDTSAENGVRNIYRSSGFGDVLPSQIVQRLLSGDRLRGLDIRWLDFDSITWGKFDDYCKAMGIRFSLQLTSAEAAWPLCCNILESANAVPFRSQGLLKVFVRETASITGNGHTYTPLPEHAASCVTIPERDLRETIQVDAEGSDALWNRLSVGWKNRSRSYADQTTVIQDEGSVSRRGVIDAAACDWHWIVDEQTALTCSWLRLRHRQRTGRTYSLAVSQKYMLHEVGDIVTAGAGQVPMRTMRLLEVSEPDAYGWIELVAEDVVVSSTSIAPPGATSGSASASVVIASPVNLPIIFVALIGGLLQVWCLLSGPSGWRGCAVQQSWDAAAWETVGSCITPSPTGHLIQDMSRLRVRPGLRVHPGLLAGSADFALADYSEGTALPPWPAWGDYLAGNPGALLWVGGELIAYAVESDNGVDQAQCSVLRRGLYGTAKGPHSILTRVGAVTDSAFRWPVPAGHGGRTCYWRFPSFGEDPADVATYSVEIPA